MACEDVFLTLCMHGTHHAWGRLSWLADIATLMVSASAPDLPQTRQKAREAGLERAVILAFRFLNEHLGLSLAGPAPPCSVPSCPFLTHLPSFFFWRFQLAVLGGRAHKLRFVLRRFFVPSQVEWRSFALPHWFYWAYYFVRPVRLFSALFGRAAEPATD